MKKNDITLESADDNYRPTRSFLKAGIITIYDDKQAIVKTIEINGGFAEVQNNKKLWVLVD